MAGVKGKSGGPRVNAGRPPKEPEKLSTDGQDDPLEFLLAVMNDVEVSAPLRVRAAIAAAQYKHTKRSDGGKKDEKDRAAKSAGEGKFAPAAPPRLVVNNK